MNEYWGDDMDPKDLPELVKQQHTNITTILLMASLDVLKKDFKFTAKQLNDFNEKLQKRAIKLQKKKG
jgi:hypothetical protein